MIMYISIALICGGGGTHLTFLEFFTSELLDTAVSGVTILKANVTPSAISGGWGHLSVKRLAKLGIAPSTLSL